jgi:hypothetical protein
MSNSVILERSMKADLNPDRLTFLPIDPFAAWPDVASRVAGLGGGQSSPGPGYAFQSLDIQPVIGPVRFTLQFHELAASRGTLTIRIQARSAYPGTVPVVIKSVALSLADVADRDGLVRVELMSRRNMVYMIGGTIDDDTDAQAIWLSLSLDPREREVSLLDAAPRDMPGPLPMVAPVGALLQRPELATMQPAILARPVSQAMTDSQCHDRLVTAWNEVLHQPEGTDLERWQQAFILQALHYYGIASDGGAALAMGGRRHPLPAYMAARGCTVLAAAMSCDDLPDGDPGLALERLNYPELCAPRRFFEAVHQTVFQDMAITPGVAGFDFLWSIDGPVGADARIWFPHMVRASMDCLRTGGLAIHMLRYSGEIGAPSDPGSTSYGRAEIERMALALIADGHEVAQLKFAIDAPQMPGDQHIPFALVIRRMR